MAIKADSIIITPQDQPETKIITIIKETNAPQETENHHILVVDGKHKKVSKKSAYMLDMLTIDEEE